MDLDIIEQLEAAMRAPGHYEKAEDLQTLMRSAREDVKRESVADMLEQQRQRKIYRACFQTEAGARCLQLLLAKTLGDPPTQFELDETNPNTLALRAARAQGASQIIHHIFEALRGDADVLDSDGESYE